ncbi:MAG: HAD family phosphatase [Litoreibacter sp.]
MTIKAVIFDIGNVLIGWDPESFYDSVIGADRRKRLFAEVDLSGTNEMVDRGHPMKELMYAKAEEHPEWRDEIRMWHDRWIEMVSPVIEHSVHLQRSLRIKGIPVLALSNFGVETFEVAEEKFPFLKEFDQRYISGQMRVIKPDPQIYQQVEDQCGFEPETLLFVDDRVENIEAARKRGWHGHIFTDAQGWAEALVSYGLLTNAEARYDG